MRKTLPSVLLASALVLSTASAWSAGLLDSIKSQAESLGGGSTTTATQPAASGSALGALGGAGGLASSLGLPSISGDTAGNAAGVLQYCIQNKYLGGTDAASIKDNLLSKAGLGSTQEQKQDSSYQQGLGGILTGSDGQTFSLDKLKGELKDKVCSYVLDHASSLL